MAKEQSAEVKLKYAAATVHTYESFGRAIVAAVLAKAAKNAGLVIGRRHRPAPF
jgi:hypothetical protein